MSVVVVMTAWNPNLDWLTEAYDSARSQLPHTERVIIVDDGSDVPIENAMRRPHQGIGPASNYAIAISDASLISRLDADDRMMPGAIPTLRRYLESHPEVDVVSGGMRYIDPAGNHLGDVQPPPMHASPKHRDRIAHSGCMFRREIWERVGGYPDMRAADWHFWNACEARARFSVLNTLVIERRIHPDSASFAHSKHLQQWWSKVKV